MQEKLSEENKKLMVCSLSSHVFLERAKDKGDLEQKVFNLLSEIVVPQGKVFWMVDESLSHAKKDIKYIRKEGQYQWYEFSLEDENFSNCLHLISLRFFIDNKRVERGISFKKNERLRSFVRDWITYSSNDIISYILEDNFLVDKMRNSQEKFSACFKYERRWRIENKKYVCSCPILIIPGISWSDSYSTDLFLLSFAENILSFREDTKRKAFPKRGDFNWGWKVKKINIYDYFSKTNDGDFFVSKYTENLMKGFCSK